MHASRFGPQAAPALFGFDGEPERRERGAVEPRDRTAGDEGSYPVDDLTAALGPDGSWIYHHKDGRPY